MDSSRSDHKEEEKKKENIAADIRICTVCEEGAHGIYFGALVCLPCKSFFIRSTRDGEPVFQCGQSQTCDISKSKRLKCQSCRYQKCVKVGMTRKEKPETVLPQEGQDLCKICHDIANGVHFGVVSCEGCKKFFRRGMKEFDTYSCKSNNDCSINPRNRNICRYCRYQKCLEAGMSRNAIKMGRPKKSIQQDKICNKAQMQAAEPTLPSTLKEPTNTLEHPEQCQPFEQPARPSLSILSKMDVQTRQLHQNTNKMPQINQNHTVTGPHQAQNCHSDIGTWNPRSLDQQKRTNEERAETYATPKQMKIEAQTFMSTIGQHQSNHIHESQSGNGFGNNEMEDISCILNNCPDSQNLADSDNIDNIEPSVRDNTYILGDALIDLMDLPNCDRVNEIAMKQRQIKSETESNNSDVGGTSSTYNNCSGEGTQGCCSLKKRQTAPTLMNGHNQSSRLEHVKPSNKHQTYNSYTWSSLFDSSYWYEPLPLNGVKVLTEEQNNLIKLLVSSYLSFVKKTDEDPLANAPKEVDTSEVDPKVVQLTLRDRIIRNTRASIEFAKSLPGFSKIREEDAFVLSKYGSFNAMIFLSAIERYDEKEKSCKGFFNWHMSHESPFYDFWKHLMVEIEKIHNLKIDRPIAAMCCMLIVIAGDWFGLVNRELVENVRAPIMEALKAYIKGFYGENSKILENIFHVVPSTRELTLWHNKLQECMSFKVEEKKLDVSSLNLSN